MHVEKHIQETLREVSRKMHEKRFHALCDVVSAALRGSRLTVTGLGRSLGGEAKEKHCIKRADRLLSNEKLLAESFEIYAAMARRILLNIGSPTIIVDWSSLSEQNGLHLLRASSPVQGRTLTIYEEVHPEAKKDNPHVHRKFLKKLRKILPEQCRPVIVTDAGFRTPWFEQVLRCGWDFVGRIRNRHMLQVGDDWIAAKSLHPKATFIPRSLGSLLMTRSNPLRCHFVLYRTKAKGRFEKTVEGKRAKRSQSRKHAHREHEPWLLASSLAAPPRKIVDLYQTRMQIEESFRDMKSCRYGLSLELSGTKSVSRMALLALIGALALWCSWLLGKATQVLGIHRSLQANTVKKRAVLSPIFLGLRAFNSARIRISRDALDIARELLNLSIRKYSYEA